MERLMTFTMKSGTPQGVHYEKGRPQNGHNHHLRRHGDLLQGLGKWPADRLQPRLAPLGRRLGHPDDVLPPARLSRHRPRPTWPRTIHPDRNRHDMDHYADDLAALTAHLDLHDAVHIGHSTGGGEV